VFLQGLDHEPNLGGLGWICTRELLEHPDLASKRRFAQSPFGQSYPIHRAARPGWLLPFYLSCP
jgi:hypothetical protein